MDHVENSQKQRDRNYDVTLFLCSKTIWRHWCETLQARTRSRCPVVIQLLSKMSMEGKQWWPWHHTFNGAIFILLWVVSIFAKDNVHVWKCAVLVSQKRVTMHPHSEKHRPFAIQPFSWPADIFAVDNSELEWAGERHIMTYQWEWPCTDGILMHSTLHCTSAFKVWHVLFYSL